MEEAGTVYDKEGIVLAHIVIAALVVFAGLVASVGTRIAPSVTHHLPADCQARRTMTIRILNKTFGSLRMSLTNGRRTQVLGTVHQDCAAEFRAEEWLDDPANQVRLVGQGPGGTWISPSVRAVGGDFITWDVEPVRQTSQVRVLKRD